MLSIHFKTIPTIQFVIYKDSFYHTLPHLSSPSLSHATHHSFHLLFLFWLLFIPLNFTLFFASSLPRITLFIFHFHLEFFPSIFLPSFIIHLHVLHFLSPGMIALLCPGSLRQADFQPDSDHLVVVQCNQSSNHSSMSTTHDKAAQKHPCAVTWAFIFFLYFLYLIYVVYPMDFLFDCDFESLKKYCGSG